MFKGLKITLRSLIKAYKSKRKHLNVTLLKNNKNLKTTTINKTTTKVSKPPPQAKHNNNKQAASVFDGLLPTLTPE